MERKRMLASVFALRVAGVRASREAVARKLGVEEEDIVGPLAELAKSGHLRASRGGLALTEKGRKAIRVVFIGGGFELIHHGHLHTVERARALGDALVVSVARDSTIRKRKGREPVADERQRVRLLEALRSVDAAILGVEGDIYETLEMVRPDVVALGYDQYHMEREVASEARKRGMKVRVVRLDSPSPEVKTSSLLGRY
ncbi:MAG: FAD synthase [archaeon]|nr:MAG: FAD synthase [archaeon]